MDKMNMALFQSIHTHKNYEQGKFINEHMQQEMELQLHKQYAVNNNSGMGTIVSIIIALMAVFYAYGYVGLHAYPSFDFLGGWTFFNSYSATAFLFTSIAVYGVLAIMTILCIEQGVKQRLEQFIIHYIRTKHYTKTEDTDRYNIYADVFNSVWSPFGKREPEKKSYLKRVRCIFNGNDLNVVQGLYSKLVRIFNSVAVAVFFFSFIRLFSLNKECCVIHVIVLFLVFALYCYICSKVLGNALEKYEEYEKKFQKLKSIEQ